MSVAQSSMNLVPTKEQWIDLGWRALWTFVEAFIGTLLGVALLDIDAGVALAALVAALGSVLSVIKTFASQRLGTASS